MWKAAESAEKFFLCLAQASQNKSLYSAALGENISAPLNWTITTDMMNTRNLSLCLLHCNEQRWSCAVQDTFVAVMAALLWENKSNTVPA